MSLSSITDVRNAPIGVFDSGFGGLTVLRSLMAKLPNENMIFLGDSARCPYGPRQLEEVEGFALQICSYLVDIGCKLIIIACNTATAAGLRSAQERFDIPIIGVVEPGSRAAVHVTRNRRVGVIATEGTVESGAYERSIKSLDAGIKVFQQAAPQFVHIAELGLEAAEFTSHDEFADVARSYLSPLRDEDIDTLVLGCTHFPLIQNLISEVIGEEVTLVSSADETAREAAELLRRRGDVRRVPEAGACDRTIKIMTTGSNAEEFRRIAKRVLEADVADISNIALPPYERDDRE